MSYIVILMSFQTIYSIYYGFIDSSSICFIELHPVNHYYANEKIIDISNSIDAIKIRIKQHELYIMV